MRVRSVPLDFNGDGFADLFIGGRSVPFNYGQIPQSYLLLNDGKGKFTDVTDKVAPDLSNIGFVTNAIWFDIDQGWPEGSDYFAGMGGHRSFYES